MSRKLNRSIYLIVFSLILLVPTGCWNRRELDELGIVVGAALDKTPGNGGLDLTAQLVKPGASRTSGQMQNGGGGSEAVLNIVSSGETVFQAVREMTHFSNRRLFWSHNNLIIIGEDLAKEGVSKSLDYFLRNEETYPTVWVMVARGKAADVLKADPTLEKIQALSIGDLANAQASTSQTTVVDLIDFSQRLISTTTAPIAGVLQMVEKDQQKLVQLSGTAVFKKDRLAGFLDEEETRGLLWVLGKVKSGILVIDRGEGKKISLEIIQARGKLIPEIRDDRILIRIAIEVLSDIGDMMMHQDLLSTAVIDTIKKEQQEVIKKEIEKALEKARSLNADIFGLGDAIHRKYPRLWRQLEERWEQYFPELEVIIDIRSNLRRGGVTAGTPSPQ